MLKDNALLLLFMLNINFLMGQTKIRLWEGNPPEYILNEVQEIDTVSNWNVPVVYGINQSELTFFKSDKKGLLPAVIICPGGGYGVEAYKHEGNDVALWFNSLGIHAFVLKYRLPDEAICEEPTYAALTDALRALQLVRKNAKQYSIVEGKIGIMGFSAGGHLAASASTLYDQARFSEYSARPDFSILMYPVISMQKDYTHMGSRNNLLGSKPETALVDLFSTELQINSKTPPAFLLHAADDEAVNVKNTMLYSEALLNAEVDCTKHIFEEGGHGFGYDESKATNRWISLLEDWLRQKEIIK
ncbi:alpha/beta hydrolase [Carboxylicivirga sp. N1Y90]|uniref:alpha/beta hydrolase n=1 Tax=Carboxylicivirga fragile TaxID=3417571 RepID=UPI003D328E4A|nr:alpha/beta hydrolase [Marinilabiliaceae bacterium N1Y90]